MVHYPGGPGGVAKTAFGAVFLVLFVAIVGRVAYELLTPIIPAVLGFLLMGAAVWFIYRRIRG